MEELDLDDHLFGVLNGMEYEECKVGDKIHRVNGPAVIWEDGAWYWWLHGKCHRYYGPSDNFDFWWIHGVQVK